MTTTTRPDTDDTRTTARSAETLPRDVDEIAPEHPTPGALDAAALEDALLGRWADTRRSVREIIRAPRLHRDPLLGMDEHRERVLGQLRILVEEKTVHRAFPAEFGGEDDHGGNIAAFADLVFADPSLQIKAGVQWGLFSSAILHLGTAEHHRAWLPSAMDLSTPGAFAMTEIGHGSDVASIATTATYDVDAQEFVIHTPFKAAWKDYLGNAALHGRAATVFAQLITGGVNHGVHCFYVPIRDEDGNFLPGVGGEDDGLKGGLNGIDNGRLHFTHVRVPRTNLLNRYGDVAEDGTYTSPIASPGRRFFTMLGTLVQGRVSLAQSATGASFLGLQGAITYAEQRRQFNATDPEREELLMDYQNHQRRLIDRLARTYADQFSANELLEKFDQVFSAKEASDDDRQELETLAAAFKPLTTWHALDTLQECREATGGMGFMARNRITQLRADLDIYVTFEGDNNVLLQLVGKRLLTDYSREFGRLKVGAVSRYVVAEASDALHRVGLHKAVQSVQDRGDERRSANWFKDPEVQRSLLTDRVRTRVADIAGTLADARSRSRAEQAAAFNTRQHELIEVARMHAELLQWEAFTRAVEALEDEQTRTVLTWLRDLFALRLIEDDLGWFVAHGRVSSQRGRALRGYVNRLAERLRPFALELTRAYGLKPEHLRMEIATDAERMRQDEAAAHYEALRASGEAPVDEKVLRDREKAARR
ncbi:acyl-CoA dehydrogenase [Micrococcus lacusdianchii]|uniref:acyl-CoA dehydrogenase family protein n=1 Tax=Micrococcus lacusdianchii TaxID=2915940 RepID=UPI0020034A8E|nr:acyl-CoA dehydrogenase [Micrococcus sp. JXJ CY 30]